VIVGYAFLPQAAGPTVAFINVATSGTITTTTTQVSIGQLVDGRITLVRGDAVNLAQGDIKYAMSINGNNDNTRYHYVEWEAYFGTTAPATKVWIDGALVIDQIVSVPWAFHSSTLVQGANYVVLCGPGGGAGTDIDDFYLLNNDGTGVTAALGDTHIVNFMPSGAGTFSEWTPNGSATNWQNVKEIPFDSDTTYNAASSSGLRDTYAEGTIAATDNVEGVQTVQVLRDDVGSAASVTLLLARGSSTATGTAMAPGGAYAPIFNELDTDPIAATTWTGSTFNSTQFGVRRA